MNAFVALRFESVDEILNHGYEIDLGNGGGGGGEGIPRNYWRGCAARFRPWLYFRPQYELFRYPFSDLQNSYPFYRPGF